MVTVLPAANAGADWNMPIRVNRHIANVMIRLVFIFTSENVFCIYKKRPMTLELLVVNMLFGQLLFG